MTEETQVQIDKIEELLISHGYKAYGPDRTIELERDLGKINSDSKVEIHYKTSTEHINGYICIDRFSVFLQPWLDLRGLLDKNKIPYIEFPSRKDFVDILRAQAEKFTGLAKLIEGPSEVTQ